MTFEYIVPNCNFLGFGILMADTLVFEDTEPQEGDFTLLQYKDKQQLVRLIGKDFLDHFIICTRYVCKYPHAATIPRKVEYKGRVIGIIKAGVYKELSC